MTSRERVLACQNFELPRCQIMRSLLSGLIGLFAWGLLLPQTSFSFFLFSLLCGSASIGAEYYVSPNGDDANTGSLYAPLRTLEGARDKVASLGRPLAQDVNVYFRSGIYRFTNTVVFGVSDGDSQFSVTYQAYADEKPVFSAGALLTNWISASDTALPFAKKQGLYFHSLPGGVSRNFVLFDNGEFLPPAASAGYSPRYKKGEAADLGIPLIKNLWCDRSGILKDWVSYYFLSNIEISILSEPFAHDFLDIIALNLAATNCQTTTAFGKLAKIDNVNDSMPDSYCVMNAPEYCDTNGEWVAQNGYGIWYLPVRGGQPGQQVEMPLLTEMIRIEGTVNYDNPTDVPVKNIRFRGITFQHGDRYKVVETDTHLHSHWNVFDRPTALVRLRAARYCEIADCVFEQSGGDGIRMDLFAINNTVDGCVFRNLGGSAVLISGYGPGTKNYSENNTVKYCNIYSIGRLNVDSPAVMLHNTGDNNILHNKISDTPYTGIAVLGAKPWNWRTNGFHEIDGSVRWSEIGTNADFCLDNGLWDDPIIFSYLHSKGNEIGYNEISDAMNRIGDGNGIYINTSSGGNRIHHNFIHHIFGPYTSTAIRTDPIVKDTQIDNNVVYNVIHAAFEYKNDNIFTNNLIVDVLDAQHPQNHFNREYWGAICLKRGPTTNGIVAGNVTYHRGTNACFLSNVPQAGEENWQIDFEDVQNDRDTLFMSRDMNGAFSYITNYLIPFGVGLNSIGLDPEFDDKARDFSFTSSSPSFYTGFQQIPLTVSMGDGSRDHLWTVRPFFDTYGRVIDSDFDEGSGQVALNKESDVNGDFLNGAIWGSGISGSAVFFPSSSGLVRYLDNDLYNSESFSAALWVNFSEINNRLVLYKNMTPKWRILLNANGKISFDTDAGAGRCETLNPILTNRWYHLAVSYDGAFTKIYLNGVMQSSNVALSMHNTGDVALRLGGFKGKADSLLFFRRDIAAEEVAKIYHQAGAVVDWEIDEGGGTLLLDSSLNGNWTRLLGYPAWGDGQFPGHYSICLDGINDCIKFDNPASAITNDLSVLFRFKTPDVLNGPVDLISKGNEQYDWDLSVRDVGGLYKLMLNMTAASGASASLGSVQTIAPGTWYHVAFTRDNTGSVKLYVNNELDNSRSGWLSEPLRNSGQTIWIGKGPRNGFSAISVDEVQIFERVLSADNIDYYY